MQTYAFIKSIIFKITSFFFFLLVKQFSPEKSKKTRFSFFYCQKHFSILSKKLRKLYNSSKTKKNQVPSRGVEPLIFRLEDGCLIQLGQPGLYILLSLKLI